MLRQEGKLRSHTWGVRGLALQASGPGLEAPSLETRKQRVSGHGQQAHIESRGRRRGDQCMWGHGPPAPRPPRACSQAVSLQAQGWKRAPENWLQVRGKTC